MPKNEQKGQRQANAAAPLTRRARWRAFQFLCRTLASNRPSNSLPAAEAESLDWLAVAEQANLDQVLPALHQALRNGTSAGIPDDFLDYLAVVHEGVTSQNRKIRQLVLELGEIFAAAGLPLLLLKGANWLMEAGPNLGGRYMADLDILVGEEDRQAAVGALDRAGFRPAAPALPYARHFHHVPLARDSDPVTIELHRHLGWQRHLLTAREALSASRPLAGSPAIRLLSPTHRFIHGCLHAQLQDMGYAAGVFKLRDLLDIQYLMAGKADALDWQAIAAFGAERGIAVHLALPLHLAHRLLGVPMPAPFAGDRLARLQARRFILQRRLDPSRTLGKLGVRLAWLLASRRHLYERNCEQATWPRRQMAIAAGRITDLLAAAGGRSRGAAFRAGAG